MHYEILTNLMWPHGPDGQRIRGYWRRIILDAHELPPPDDDDGKRFHVDEFVGADRPITEELRDVVLRAEPPPSTRGTLEVVEPSTDQRFEMTAELRVKLAHVRPGTPIIITYLGNVKERAT